ncbi:MAG: SH3 domain-containing protein, partial [Alistipes sp.]|nr:SH3 domain-containing protein [Alistipes sp.]
SIKSSPDRSATELFVLHEGTKVTIGEAIDGWAEVRIADGRKGWIEEERIERI